jgi:hypothetical protein
MGMLHVRGFIRMPDAEWPPNGTPRGYGDALQLS